MNKVFEAETASGGRVGGGARGRWAVVALLGSVLVTAAACSSGTASPTTTSGSHSTTSTSAGSTTSSSSSPVVEVAHVGSDGVVLVNHAGLTLYRYTPDGTGKSTCTGGCATAWPPVTVPAGTTKVAGAVAIGNGSLGTITRSDGTLQVTYKGMPLYTFTGDMSAGEANGQGAGGIWFVVPVTSSSAASGTHTSTTTSTVASGSGY